MSKTESREDFKHWALLELMGHRQIAGLVTEVEIGGSKMLRIDVPADGHLNGSEVWKLTQFYGGGAVYCITPVSEEVARIKAARVNVAPVHVWELPKPEAAEADPDDFEIPPAPQPAPRDDEWGADEEENPF